MRKIGHKRKSRLAAHRSLWIPSRKQRKRCSDAWHSLGTHHPPPLSLSLSLSQLVAEEERERAAAEQPSTSEQVRGEE